MLSNAGVAVRNPPSRLATVAGSLQPVDRRPLYERVVARLREFIDTEHLQPGDRLMSERDLAKRLAVSRTSVRQAFTALRVMGVVEIRHGDGIYLLRTSDDLVPSLAKGLLASHAHFSKINEIREALEPQAARLAARRRTTDDLAALHGALAQMEHEIDRGDSGVDGDDRFHRALVAATHNDVLATLIEQLAPAMAQTSQASLARPEQPRRSLSEHRAVLEAVARRDEEQAYLSMRVHVRDFSDLELTPREDER